MKRVQCMKGHYYDAERFGECPVCKSERGNIDDIGDTVPMSFDDDLPLTVAIEATGYDTVPIFDDDDDEKTIVLSREDKKVEPTQNEEYVEASMNMKKINRVRCVNGHFFDRDKFVTCPVCGRPEEGATIPWFEVSKEEVKEVAGWLVCVSGKYKGRAFECTEGRNRIGNNMSFEISLFMEESITKDVHAYLIYEPRNFVFYLENGIGNGLVYLNDEILFSHSKLEAYDRIQIGKVKFVFVPLCGEKFKWADYAD